MTVYVTEKYSEVNEVEINGAVCVMFITKTYTRAII
jgi:hypothetical protein